jgi:hypothetical protein
MIAKIYIEKGTKTKRVGGRGLTLTRIVLRHNKNFRGVRPKRERNGKIGRRYYSSLARIAHYKGETKQRRTILTLISLYAERETCPLSLLKVDTSPFTCVIGDVPY